MGGARHIERLLMKGRRVTFWGRRAMVTVRIPLVLLPEPPPSTSFTEGWGEEWAEGHWEEKVDGGAVIQRSISLITSGRPPWPLRAGEYFLDRSPWGGWEWWEGRFIVPPAGGAVRPYVGSLTEQEVGAFRAFQSWRRRVTEGSGGTTGAEWLDRISLDAGYWAK